MSWPGILQRPDLAHTFDFPEFAQNFLVLGMDVAVLERQDEVLRRPAQAEGAGLLALGAERLLDLAPGAAPVVVERHLAVPPDAAAEQPPLQEAEPHLHAEDHDGAAEGDGVDSGP